MNRSIIIWLLAIAQIKIALGAPLDNTLTQDQNEAEEIIESNHDKFSKFYYENLKKASWPDELYPLIADYMSNLRDWTIANKDTIIESGLNEELYKKLQNAIVGSLNIANRLAISPDSCIQQLLLKESYEQTFELLSLVRDTKLASEWWFKHRQFEADKKSIKERHMEQFVYKLEDKIPEFIQSLNYDERNEHAEFIEWYSKFSKRYLLEESVRKLPEIRLFFPKGPIWQRDCDFKNTGL
uniref:Angiotensin-converting enzyme n=1 Tax=Stomoxys calcitrans TaxID=35570 RepID=A0A1I8Q1F5_STOCA